MMCVCGLAGVVLRVCGAALRGEKHALHAPAMYMLERLAAHALRPNDLRYAKPRPVLFISPEKNVNSSRHTGLFRPSSCIYKTSLV